MIMKCVFCDIYSCRHNDGNGCQMDIISIEIKQTGEFDAGKRLSYPVCKNYEDRENDRD